MEILNRLKKIEKELERFEEQYEIKRVIRKNKNGVRKLVKKKKCKEGWKWNGKLNRCVKMSPTERMNRSKGGRQASRKRARKMDIINRERKKSLEKRKALNLDKQTKTQN